MFEPVTLAGRERGVRVPGHLESPAGTHSPWPFELHMLTWQSTGAHRVHHRRYPARRKVSHSVISHITLVLRTYQIADRCATTPPRQSATLPSRSSDHHPILPPIIPPIANERTNPLPSLRLLGSLKTQKKARKQGPIRRVSCLVFLQWIGEKTRYLNKNDK